MSINKVWFNKNVGGLGFGMAILIAFIGGKIAQLKLFLPLVTAAQWGLFFWDISWFAMIILSAVAADLFENADTWTQTTITLFQNEAINREERISMIKSQLEVAVNRYMTVFLMVNGFNTTKEKIKAIMSKLLKGNITIKEVIIILGYAIYDLIVRNINMDVLGPFDTVVVFVGIIILKIVDANSGIAKIISQMYLDAKKVKEPNKILTMWKEHIIELAHLFHIEMQT